MEDAIKILSTILQTASIVLTAMFAIAGLEAWRRQLVGKRKMEVAEQMLSATYQFRDAMLRIRSPAGFSGEGESRKRDEHESEQVARQRDTYYAPLARIKAHSDAFARMTESAYMARVYFGQRVVEAFLSMKQAVDAVAISAHMLVMTAGERGDQAQRRKWEEDIWNGLGGQPDHITKKIEDAIAIIEHECRPYVSNPPTPWFLRWLVRS